MKSLKRGFISNEVGQVIENGLTRKLRNPFKKGSSIIRVLHRIEEFLVK